MHSSRPPRDGISGQTVGGGAPALALPALVDRQNRSGGERRNRTGLEEAVAVSERCRLKALRPAALHSLREEEAAFFGRLRLADDAVRRFGPDERSRVLVPS